MSSTRLRTFALGLGLGLGLLLALPAVVSAQVADSTMWIPNATVFASLKSGNTLYLGGDFTYLGPRTGGLASFSVTTGEREAAFPAVEGSIRSIEPDGAGGWYVGGDFTRIGGVARTNLAHVLSDFSVAPWAPACGGPVYTLCRSGSRLYVGGYFSTAGGSARSNFAAFDLSSGLLTAYAPQADGIVERIVASNGRLAVAGDFLNIGGAARARLAALDTTTAAATAWNPAPDGSVFTMMSLVGVLYVGGSFTSIGGATRTYLAAFDEASDALTGFAPSINGPVMSLAGVFRTFYIGGRFSTVNGQARANLAAFDRPSGTVLAWNPGTTYDVASLLVSDGALFVGGLYEKVGGITRNNVARVDLGSGAVAAWNPGTNGVVMALGDGAGRVIAGGAFSSAGGVPRNRLAAIDVATGEATAWNPDANSTVRALYVRDGTVWAGGTFTQVGGAARTNLAALDSVTAAATAWNPAANGPVYALVADSTTLYVGGDFTSMFAASRQRLAGFTLTSGALTSLAGYIDNAVNALALSNGNLYAGGDFTSFFNYTRYRAAAVQLATGTLTSWNPSFNNTVRAMAANARTVYVGGNFTTMGGYSRGYLAPVNPFTGGLSNNPMWSRQPSYVVSSLAISGSTLFVGGAFTSFGGVGRLGVAAVDTLSGQLLSWNPDPNSYVESISLAPGWAYVGGGFTTMGGRAQVGFGAVSLPAPQIVISALSQNEGQSGATSFLVPVGLTLSSSTTVTVDYAVSDSTALVSDADYLPSSGTLTFSPGATNVAIPLTVQGDTKFEPSEYAVARLSSPAGAVLGNNRALVMLGNDDPTPTITVADFARPEGATGVSSFDVPVTLSNPSYLPIAVNWVTADSSALAASDYSAGSGTVNIAAGQASGTISVPVVGDSTLERDEVFRLNLSGASNATLARATAYVTILTDEMGPVLTDVADAPNDQGGWVWLSLDRCILDVPTETAHPVFTYNVWRKLSPSPAAASRAAIAAAGAVPALDARSLDALSSWPVELRDGRVILEANASAAGPAAYFPPGTWGIVASFAAMQEPGYRVLAPTAADSPTASEFVISAHTSSPAYWCVGWSRAGASTDDIAPGVPASFTAQPAGASVALAWAPSDARDFQYFRVHRGASADFVPGEANVVQQTAALAWTDPAPGAGAHWYKLVAMDHAGNASAPATASATLTLDTPGEPLVAFALSVPAPNPSADRVTLEFAVPRPSAARVAIYDVGGRLVRVLHEGALQPGRHAFTWDGRDEAGGPCATGIYLCRAESSDFRAVRRVVRVR